MNRRETIEQLNQERKKRENLVWQEYLASPLSTAKKVAVRNLALDRIREEYEQSIVRTEREEKVRKEPLQAKQSLSSPKSEIILGTENLPENKPLFNPESTFRNTPRDTVPQEEPSLVQRARSQNIRESLQAQGKQTKSWNVAASENGSKVAAQADAIREQFALSGIVLSDVSTAIRDEDLVKEMTEAKNTALVNFPTLILFVAVVKDCLDIISAMTSIIPVVGIIIIIFAIFFSALCSIFLWYWMLGQGNMLQRRIIKIFVIKRLPIIMIGLFGETLPWVSLIPTTTVTVFFIAQISTKLGQTILKAVDKAESL